jgi:hypothetical protein
MVGWQTKKQARQRGRNEGSNTVEQHVWMVEEVGTDIFWVSLSFFLSLTLFPEMVHSFVLWFNPCAYFYG